MEAILERVGGVDVGQATVVATVLVGAPHERPKKETRTFRTLTRELLEMREWFLAKGVTHVALEGTGIYWRPVYVLLEDAFDIIVGNAHHIKNRSEEHTSELQSRLHLVCRLLLEKKKK